MSERAISAAEARRAWRILVEECRVRDDETDEYGFVYAVTRGCREYRFQGALGFGGKFRNNGNRGGIPYVDCYQEDETPARLYIIEKANERLAEIFGDTDNG